MRWSFQCERGLGDREIGDHGKGLVCQLGEAWDHCPCCSAPLFLKPSSPSCSASFLPPTLKLYTLIWLFCLLMTQAYRFFPDTQSTLELWHLGGLMDWSRLFTAVPFSRMTHKRTKRSLCLRESFSSPSQHNQPKSSPLISVSPSF